MLAMFGKYSKRISDPDFSEHQQEDEEEELCILVVGLSLSDLSKSA